MSWPGLDFLCVSLSLVHDPRWENRSFWFVLEILYNLSWLKETVPAICICGSVDLKRILSSFTCHLSTHVPLLSKATFNYVCTSIHEIAWIVQACLSEEHQSVLYKTANGDSSLLSLITLIKRHNTDSATITCTSKRPSKSPLDFWQHNTWSWIV